MDEVRQSTDNRRNACAYLHVHMFINGYKFHVYTDDYVFALFLQRNFWVASSLGRSQWSRGTQRTHLGGGVQGKTLGSKKVCCTNRGAPRALRLLVWKWLARTSLLPHCAVR